MITAFFRRPIAAITFSWVLILVLASVFAPLLAPYPPDQQDIANALQGPSSAHPLGTGTLGLDVLSRILYGGRITLLSTLISLVTYIGVGLPAGLAAAYIGGWVDRMILRISDIFYAIPGIIIVLVVLAIWPNNESAAMIALGLLAAPSFARVVRSAALGVSQELYVRAARANGTAQWRILLHHLLPGVASTVIVHVALFATAAVGVETGLGFLGLGSNQVTWGQLVAEASNNLSVAPWLLVPSGLLITTFVLALGLCGDGVRDAAAQVRSQAPATHRAHRTDLTDVHRRVIRSDPRPRSEDALLQVCDLSVAFDIDGVPTPVVTGVDLEIGEGERLGIVGESGSGKSVSISALVGLLSGSGRVLSGSMYFDGDDFDLRDPDAVSALRGRRIGLIGQNPAAALDPSYTIASQLAEVIQTHTGRRGRALTERVQELLTTVRLRDPERVAACYPHQLSGGMAQRVGIALALAGEPRLLLADEPTTALDVTVQAEILDVLRTVDAAVILVTHDWGVLTDLCTRAVVMYAGQVVESGPTSQLLASPQHAYTGALLCSNPYFATRGEPLPAIPGAVIAPQNWPLGCRFADRCALACADCTADPIELTPRQGAGTARCIHPDQVLTRYASAGAPR